MYITYAISYGNAWAKLNKNYQNIQEEITKSIDILNYQDAIEYYKEFHKNSETPRFDSYLIRRYWRSKMRKNDWLMISHTKNTTNIDLSLLGFIKNKISLNFFHDTETLNRWLYSITPLAIKNGNIEIPVVITLLPQVHADLKNKYDIQSSLDPDVFTRFYLDINRLSPLSHEFPFLVLGISFEEGEDIDVREIESKVAIENSHIKVNRCIEFPPEYHQAGLGILNYFGTVLRESYPEQNAKVKIEQDGLKVRLIVESENGDQKIIEKALHEYELVLRGETAPEDFYLSPIKALELKNQLRVFQFQVESQRDLIALQQGQIKTLTELAQAALSKPVAPITVVSNFHNTNTQNTQVNFKAELHQSHDDLEKLINLTDDESIKNRLRDIQNALDNATTRETPEEVQNSSGMKKLGNLLNEANEVGTQANGLLEKGAAAIDLLKKLGRHYNRVAEWCGLPVVPGVLVAENKD